ncbi:hypothetical protein BJX61DRAFT_539612 [Aspergillus egyptiacus]|nr:hypothetical protein BJX61DRAFT_539612 [Aspergillus egyptiacus]
MSARWRGSNIRRGSGRGGWNRALGRRAGVASGPPAPALGPLLATLNRSKLQGLCSDNSPDEPSPSITNCKLIGSYNWANRKCPTILVPGSPPAWTPFQTPDKLPEDSGTYFRDQNAARLSVHLFEPAMEAILQQDPGFELHNIDLVACRSTLRSLFEFVSHPEKGFRIVVEAVGSTVFLVRQHNSPTETTPDVREYGHTFPEANTTWGHDFKGSESHQRILQYELGGLKCVIRHGADGYLPDLHQTRPSHVEAAANGPGDLLPSFEYTKVSSIAGEEKQTLTVEAGAQAVPQSAVFELKTRSFRKEYEGVLEEQLVRLWAAQIPNFVVAFYHQGVFKDVGVDDVRDEIRRWEVEQEGSLRKLVALLKTLIVFAQGQPEGRLEVVFQSGEELELREVGGLLNRCISDSLKTRCAGNASATEGTGGKMFDGEKSADAEEVEAEEKWRGEKWERESCGWSESDSEKDFTAGSASSCGYCGQCTY